MPHLPSAHEQGLSNFEASAWHAVFLPKGTPAAIVRRLHEAFVATMESKIVQQRLHQLGATIVAQERRTPEYLAKFVVSEMAKWAATVKAANVETQ